MLVRVLVCAALTGGLWSLLSPPKDLSRARGASAAGLLGLLAWTLLVWTRDVRLYEQAFPAQISVGTALLLAGAGILLGAAAFAAAGDRAGRGALFGLTASAVGAFASCWPQIARALQLGGWAFGGPFLATLLPAAYAATVAAIAAVFLLKELQPRARALALAAVAAWAAPTILVESALTRWWGFGPRSLAEAAGVPTNDDAQKMTIVRLTPSRGRSVSRETVRMAAEGVDLSQDNLTKLEEFLQASGYRGVFAPEALKDVRQGWRQWWEAERALDAALIAAPGRVHPDYRRALELLKAGPLDADRYAKLEQLASAAARSSAGFEDVTESQYIFEGFSAAYARFGDEANARKWLYRIDNLWPISEKKIEVTPVEDFREGRVRGLLLLDGRAALGVRVGLFYISVSSATGATSRLLSSSTFPEENGEYSFQNLGPGDYEVALLGRPQDLRGRIAGAPGNLEIGYERPEAVLPAIRVERDVLPVPEAFSPGGLPEAPVPEVPEPALRWPRR